MLRSRYERLIWGFWSNNVTQTPASSQRLLCPEINGRLLGGSLAGGNPMLKPPAGPDRLPVMTDRCLDTSLRPFSQWPS